MNSQNTPQSLPHVVIVGSGFGGLNAARKLAGQPVRVTLIDRNNYHLFTPLLYQVASAGISPHEIAYPLRSIFRRQKNLEFRLAEVNRIDLAGQKLETSTGEIAYDALVLAAGGQTNFFGNQSLARNSLGMKGLPDAAAIRNHLLGVFERASLERDEEARRALLTFVVAGGGPTGVEMAGAIAELVHLVTARDFPGYHLQDTRVLLLEGSDHLLPAMPPRLQRAALESLERKHIEVRLNTMVQGYDGRQIDLADGSSIRTTTLVWAAGIRAAGLVDSLPLAKAALGRVRVKPSLQVPDHPRVFVIGDAAYLEDDQGLALPMVAQVAIQQGQLAAQNILRLLDGQPLRPFRYRDPGIMATIGRNQAVARLGSVELRGLVAWLTWLVVHLYQLVGFRNRLVVMINWAWDYLFYERAVRLIMPAEKEEIARPPMGFDKQEMASRG